MKKIFADTNILVDLIADRKPFSKFAIDLFHKAENKKVKIFASSNSITTTHYFLKKYIEEKELRAILYNLLDLITILPIDMDIGKRGLRSNHKDFEDALQINCASPAGVDCIVTRNIKDFRNCEFPVLTPDKLYRQLN